MKLISNKSNGSLFKYFQEIDESMSDWSDKHPVVCHGSSQFIIPGTSSSSALSVSRFFIFKVVGGTNCVMSVDTSGINYQYYGFAFSVDVYDYLSFGLDSYGNWTGHVQSGVIGVTSTYNSSIHTYETERHVMTIDTSITRVLVARVMALRMNESVQYVPDTPIRIVFSNLQNPSVRPIMDLDTSAHFSLDYAGAIDASCWNLAGKVYRHKSLCEMGRRRFPYSNPPFALRSGVLFKKIPVPLIDYGGGQMHSTEEELLSTRGKAFMMLEFASSERNGSMQTGTVDGFSTDSFHDNDLLRGVMFDAVVRFDSSEVIDFRVSCDGSPEVLIKIGDDVSRYYDFSKWNSVEYLAEGEVVDANTAILQGVHFQAGWTRIAVYCRSPECINRIGLQDNQSWSLPTSALFSLQARRYSSSASQSFIPLSDSGLTTFVPNDIDIDRIITVDDVFRNSSVTRFLDGNAIMFDYDDGTYGQMAFDGGLPQNGITLGIDFRMPSIPQSGSEQFNDIVVNSSIIRMVRTSVDDLSIIIINDWEGGNEFVTLKVQVKFKQDEWQSLFVTLEKGSFGWYLMDNEVNGIMIPDGITSTDFANCTEISVGYGVSEDSSSSNLATHYYHLRNVFVIDRILKFSEMHELFMHRSD